MENGIRNGIDSGTRIVTISLSTVALRLLITVEELSDKCFLHLTVLYEESEKVFLTHVIIEFVIQ